MVGIICSYQDCMTRKLPCSAVAFFGLPNDSRRPTWIRNSGNKELARLTAKQIRYLCEKHFLQCDIRLQFNRKTLRRHAVPIPHCEIVDMTEQGEEEVISMLQTELAENQPETGSNPYGEQKSNDEEHNAVLYVEYEDDSEINQSDDALPYAIDLDVQLDDCIELDKEMTDKLAQDAEESFNSDTIEIAQPSAAGMEPESAPPMCTVVPDLREDYASDRHFALSLVNYFQRLGAEKKAMAKVKILTYLTALEFGTGGEL